MTTTQHHAGEPKSIPFKQIRIIEDLNYRNDTVSRKEMAASLHERGQMQPILVEASGTGDQPYTLIAGRRRMLGFEDNGWTNREVLCVVKQYKKGEAAIGRLVDQWRENEDRENPSVLDKAERAFQLVEGTYPVLEGETAKPIAKDKVCELLGISTVTLNDLLRIHKQIDPAVAKKARKAQVPMRVLRACSAIDAKTEEQRTEKQAETIDTWVETQKALEESGRRRAPKQKKKAKKTEAAEPVGVISSERKIPSGYVDRAAEEPKPKKYAAADYVVVLKAKQASADKTESIRLQGMIDAFRFLTGEVAKLPGLVAADFKVLEESEEEDEAGDKAAE